MIRRNDEASQRAKQSKERKPRQNQQGSWRGKTMIPITALNLTRYAGASRFYRLTRAAQLGRSIAHIVGEPRRYLLG